MLNIGGRMGSGKSGPQMAADNFVRFQVWIRDREHARDWNDYWRGDKLSRTNIAAECGFGTSALRQNPAIKAQLEALETRLKDEMASGPTSAKKTAQNTSNQADNISYAVLAGRLTKAKSSADKRVKALEEQNATLRAELATLRVTLANYEHIEAHLGETGKWLRP
jgi:hypothetical protein